MLSKLTLEGLLMNRAETQNPRELLFYPLGNTSAPSKVSYHKLYTLAKSNSRLIRDLPSFKDDQPILLHVNDHWDTILWFWSIRLAKGLPVLSSPFSNVDEQRQRHIKGISDLLGPSICITREESLPLFGEVAHAFEMRAIEGWDHQEGNHILNGSERKMNACNDDAEPNPQELAMLMLTSGSTGNAKAVGLTHHQVLSSVAGKSEACVLPTCKPFLNWIGLDHVGAMVEIHFHALWAGVDQIHVHPADVVSSPSIFLELLSRHQVSRSFAPNFFLGSLVSTMASTPENQEDTAVDMKRDLPYDLSNLRFLVSGGEANDVKTCIEVSNLLEKYGAPKRVISPGFGMTETCAGCIYNTVCPDNDIAQGYTVASLGKCIKGMRMRVTIPSDESTETIKIAQVDEEGGLEVQGDNVFKGYYKNPAATAESFTADGWFRTGDRAAIDTNGNLRLVGRVKEVANINGIKVPIADIQSALEQVVHDQELSRVVAFPTRAAHTEQIVIACVPRTWPMKAEQIVEVESLLVPACILASSSRPLIFTVSQASFPLLPVTTLGKISPAKMRTLFEQGLFELDVLEYRRMADYVQDSIKTSEDCSQEPHPTDPIMKEIEDSLLQDIISMRRDINVKTIATVNTPIWELGFSSMDLVRLRYRVNNRLDASIPLIMFMKHPTARSLARVLGKYRRQNSSTGTNGTTDNLSVEMASTKLTSPVTERSSQYDQVVTFRSDGTKTPLWLVHPGVGEVLVFVGLVQQLQDEDRPIYALRARGFEPGEGIFGSIEETVDKYVVTIQQRQPQGPYAIAGYSYGAMLAFEVAKRLPDGEVRFLGSFNLPPHIKMRMRQLNWNMCLINLAYFVELVSEDEAKAIEQEEAEQERTMENESDTRVVDTVSFSNWDRRTALARIMSTADESRLMELGLGEKEIEAWTNVAYGLQSMAIDYEPTGMADVIDVFHAIPLRAVASSREQWLRDHLYHWRDFCRTEPKFHAVDGAHYTMIGPEHVEGFAKTLKEVLKVRGV